MSTKAVITDIEEFRRLIAWRAVLRSLALSDRVGPEERAILSIICEEYLDRAEKLLEVTK